MFKNKRKEYKRKLNEIGIRKFEFNFHKEKNIYTCLCLVPGYRRILKEIEDEYKFGSYGEWKKYIEDKRKSSNKQDLMEFSRYLNQRLRNVKPVKQANEIFVSVALALVIEKFVEVLLESTEIVSITETRWEILIVYALIMLGIAGFVFVLWNLISPIWDYNLEENFILDYKEIVDNLIDKADEHNDTEK